jgi:hypothetical protein
MRTKVNNCGNYNCAHCSPEGICCICSISITPEGKCAQYKLREGRTIPFFTEQDKHTNMC